MSNNSFERKKKSMAAPSDSSNLQSKSNVNIDIQCLEILSKLSSPSSHSFLVTIFGSYALGAGLCSIFKPELSLLVFSPLTSTIEKLTGLVSRI